MTQDWIAHHKHLESLMRRLLTLSSKNFTLSEIREVEEYIDENEYGVALRFFRGICVEEKKPPLGKESRKIIEELISMMKYESEFINKFLFEDQK